MTSAPLTLWQTLEKLARHAPLSPAKVEQVLGNILRLDAEAVQHTRWLGDEVILKENVRVSQTGLTILNKHHQAIVGLFLSGPCIGREEIEAQYGALELAAAPRGRSPDESTVWQSQQPWGQVRFYFKENNPMCLHSVSLTTSASVPG